MRGPWYLGKSSTEERTGTVLCSTGTVLCFCPPKNEKVFFFAPFYRDYSWSGCALQPNHSAHNTALLNAAFEKKLMVL